MFGVGFITVAILGLLLSGYKDRLQEDVTELGTNERLVHLGVVVAGLSVAAFSVAAFLLGSVFLLIGVTVALIGARRLSTASEPLHK